MAKRAPLESQVNWNQVYYFSQVATFGSLKDAAAALGLSPSTLSEHVAQLEKDLGVRLFHRHHRKLELTAEGARILRYAKQMFETGLRLIDVVAPSPLGQYPVAVGLVPGSSLPIAYELIQEYVREPARASVRFQHASHEGLERGLAESKFDFGFTDREPERKDLRWQAVSASDLGFYARADLAARGLAELLETLPLVVCGLESAPRERVERALAEAGIQPRSVITTDYPSLLLDLCRGGQGVAVLSEAAARRADAPGIRPVRRGRKGPAIRDQLIAVWPAGAEGSAPVQRLKELLLRARA